MRHAQAASIPSLVVLLTTVVGCVGQPPPPPLLTVTTPHRGMIQRDAGQIVVEGTARPGPSGDRVAQVLVNHTPATLAADGTFTASVTLPAGASLLETVAISEEGGAATDARAVQVGELRPVGTSIDRAITAAVSADAFAKLSAVAGPALTNANLSALLAPLQPIANLGDDLVSLELSITNLTIGDARITLTPVDGGLAISVELDALGVGANAAYGGALVPDGSTSVRVTADHVTIAGTLVVTPAGAAGFTTTLTSPTVRTTGLRLGASGLVGQVLNLMNSQLGSTVQRVATRSTELALDPLINDALGALAGPQHIEVLGQLLELQTSPSAVTFTRAGALVTLNLQAKLEGSDASPGYVFTPNGTPTLDPASGLQLGLADDLVNELLAEVHALGLLDLHLQQDFGVFDAVDLALTLPPMISADRTDGALRLVLGDMVVTVSDHGKPLITAAVNAQIDLEIQHGATPQQLALQFGQVHVFVNPLGDPTNPGDVSVDDLSGVATAGIALQLDSLSQVLITVPVPSVAGVSFDHLALRADSGYVVVSGDIH